jgi:hypothetical protein
MIRGRYQMWTTGQHKQLAELWQQPQLSIEEIALAMHRSESSVQTKAKSLGLPNRLIMRRQRSDHQPTDADRACGAGV